MKKETLRNYIDKVDQKSPSYHAAGQGSRKDLNRISGRFLADAKARGLQKTSKLKKGLYNWDHDVKVKVHAKEEVVDEGLKDLYAKGKKWVKAPSRRAALVDKVRKKADEYHTSYKHMGPLKDREKKAHEREYDEWSRNSRNYGDHAPDDPIYKDHSTYATARHFLKRSNKLDTRALDVESGKKLHALSGKGKERITPVLAGNKVSRKKVNLTLVKPSNDNPGRVREERIMRKYTLRKLTEAAKIEEACHEGRKELYDAHHERATKYLQGMLDHLNNHKKVLDKHAEKEDWDVSHPYNELRDISRQLEDMHENMKDRLTTDVDDKATQAVPSSKNRMGGTPWSNYKVNK